MNNKADKIKFTNLTPDDITTHEGLYIEILATYSSEEIKHQHGIIPSAYWDYMIDEITKRKIIFQETFK